jgi:hypothetical protein
MTLTSFVLPLFTFRYLSSLLSTYFHILYKNRACLVNISVPARKPFVTHLVFMFVRSPRHRIEISLTAGSPSGSVKPTPIPRVCIPSNSVHNNQYVTCRLWSELCLNALYFFPFFFRSVDVSLSFGARCPYESDCLLTETHVSYSLLRQEFQFVGLLSARLDPQNIFPLGPSLPVSGDCVCEFVEQFQFFTAVHLRLLARAHGVRFTSRTRRDALLDLLRLHTLCSCRSPPVLHFRRSPQPRQNVLLVLLAPPPLRPGPERSRNLRLSNRTSYGRLFDPLDRHPRHCCNVILVRPRVAIPLPAPFFLAARRSPSSPHVHHSSLFNRVCLCFRRAISRYWYDIWVPLYHRSFT